MPWRSLPPERVTTLIAPVGDTGREVEIHGRDLELLHHFLREAHRRTGIADRRDAAPIDRDPRSPTAVAARRVQNRHERAIVVVARRRLNARFELGQLEKAAAVQRQAFDLTARDQAIDGGRIVVHLRRGGIHGHRLLHVPDTQVEIRGGGDASLDGGSANHALETWSLDAHLIIAG